MVKDFTRRLLHEHNAQKKNDLLYRRGAKDFADQLNKAREEDALEFLHQARASISGLSDTAAKRTMCVLACNKLFDLGYREFAGVFKEVLQRGEK